MWHWFLDGVLLLLLLLFMVDGLTWLWVRRVYALVYQSIFGVVVLIDLDGLKSVNDQYGHPAGNQVLRRVGRILLVESRLRAFRYGGDEFALFLPFSDWEKAKELVEKIKERVESDPLIKKYGVTISYGIGKTEQEADLALYEMKERGK